MSQPKKPDKINIDLEDLDDASTGQEKITISFPPEERQAKQTHDRRGSQNDQLFNMDFQAQKIGQSESLSVGSVEYPKAGLGYRVLAQLVDGVITYLPLIIAFIIYTRTLTGMLYGSMGPYLISIFLLLAGVFWTWFYLLVRDGLGQGQSIGKKIFGLMVVRLEDNQPCTKANSAIRNLYAIALSFIDIIIAMIHEKGQRYGDSRLNTQVIEKQDYRK